MPGEETADYQRSFGFLLYDAARLLRRDFDRRARAIGLTRAQWSVLAHLSRNEGISQAGLADILDIEPITLARLLDKLEEAGWVERRPHATDRRVYTLYITAKAWPLIAQIRALAAETREVALAGVSPQEQARLVEVLTRVRANLSLRPSEAPTAAAAGADDA